MGTRYFGSISLCFFSLSPPPVFLLCLGARGVKLLVRGGIGYVVGLVARLTESWLSACRVRGYIGLVAAVVG